MLDFAMQPLIAVKKRLHATTETRRRYFVAPRRTHLLMRVNAFTRLQDDAQIGVAFDVDPPLEKA